MYNDLKKLNGCTIVYDGSNGTIEDTIVKGYSPYIVFTCPGKPGNKQLRIDASAANRIRADKETRDCLREISTEYIQNRLVKTYARTYELINSSKKDERIFASFPSGDDGRDNLQVVLQMAKEGMPEAIFELCSFHRSASRELEGCFDSGILSLFGYKTEKYPACGLINIFETKNAEKKAELKRAREIIISGTEDGFYGEDGVTLSNILGNILPVATRDILDSLYEYYNGPDAFVVQKDRDAFNAVYKEKYSFKKTEEENSADVKKKREAKSFRVREKETLEQIHKHDYSAIANNMKSDSSYGADEKLAVAYTVCSGLREDEETETIRRRAEQIILGARENRIKNLLYELSFKEKESLLNKPFLKGRISVTPDWKAAVMSEFEHSIGNDFAGWWIGYMNDTGLLVPEYGRNAVFWGEIKPSYMPELVSVFRSSLVPENFVSFATEILRMCKGKRAISNDYCEEIENTKMDIARLQDELCHLANQRKEAEEKANALPMELERITGETAADIENYRILKTKIYEEANKLKVVFNNRERAYENAVKKQETLMEKTVKLEKIFSSEGGSARIASIWQHEMLSCMTESMSLNDGLRAFRNAQDVFLDSRSDEMVVLEQLFEMASEHYASKNNQKPEDTQSDKAEMAEKLAACMKPIDDLEQLLAKRRLAAGYSSGATTETLKKVLDIKDELGYFGDHEWNSKIVPVVNPSDYLVGKPIRFDPRMHVCEEELETGEMVIALTSGLMVNGKVKNRARVIRAKNRSVR